MQLKKQLSFIHVFSIASGAMISSGIFILPGLAFSRSGPAVFVAYLLAGLLALLGSLSVVELATAMPKAGGDYYFVTRSMGPLSGTISGIFSWVAISLKSAFAILGMAEVLHLLTGLPLPLFSILLCAGFVILNIYGVQETARLEVILVLTLLGLMTGYIILGAPHIQIIHFDPYLPHGINSVFSTVGFVFVSFGGLISVASVAEEVKNPKRNLPLGLISAVVVVTLIYTVLLLVTVGILPPEELRGSLTPIADTARIFIGTPGYVIITIAAVFAFVTTAIAGVMAASRYPLALSRDRLIPNIFSRLGKRSHTPVVALVLTGVFIIISLLLPLEILVKAASTVILAANLFANLAVIILRESKVRNYQPSFKIPFYPWLPIINIILFGFFIVDMGLETIEISLGFLVLALLVYFFYGRKRVKQEYALLHVFARIANRKISSSTLEDELRAILHQRDDIIHDFFDELVKTCPLLDLDSCIERSDFFRTVSEKLAPKAGLAPEKVMQLLEKREQEMSTVLSPFVAIPHLVIEEAPSFEILVARCRSGIRFNSEFPAVQAVFVILGASEERNRHLKTLAAIAQIVQQPHFEQKWQQANTEQQLRHILLLSPRRRDHEISV